MELVLLSLLRAILIALRDHRDGIDVRVLQPVVGSIRLTTAYIVFLSGPANAAVIRPYGAGMLPSSLPSGDTTWSAGPAVTYSRFCESTVRPSPPPARQLDELALIGQ